MKFYACNVHDYVEYFKVQNDEVYKFIDKKWVGTIVCGNRLKTFKECSLQEVDNNTIKPFELLKPIGVGKHSILVKIGLNLDTKYEIL